MLKIRASVAVPASQEAFLAPGPVVFTVRTKSQWTQDTVHAA